MENVKKRFAKRVSETKAAAKKLLLDPVNGKKGAKSRISAEKFLDKVQFRAYENFLQRGGNHGNDQNDWFEAERQVRGELGL